MCAFVFNKILNLFYFTIIGWYCLSIFDCRANKFLSLFICWMQNHYSYSCITATSNINGRVLKPLYEKNLEIGAGLYRRPFRRQFEL